MTTAHKYFGRSFWLVAVAAFLLQLVALEPTVNPYDDGIILVGAEAISNGRLPYRDFWTMYGPGQFYLVSWVFDLFGPSTLSMRLIGIVAKTLVVALMYAILQSRTKRSTGLIGATLMLGILISVRQDIIPIFPVTALVLLAAICLDKAREGRRGFTMLAGLLTGLGACFRHDMGVYAALAASLALLMDGWRLHGRAGLRPAWASIARYLGGVAIVCAPVAAYFLMRVPFADLYENLIYIPSAIYPHARNIPWPGLTNLSAARFYPYALGTFCVFVPFVVCGLALGLELWRARRGETDAQSSFLILLLSLTGLLFTLKGIVRVHPLHMTPALAPSVILALLMLARLEGARLPAKLAAAVVTVPLFAVLSLQSAIGYRFIRGGTEDGLGARPLADRCAHPFVPRSPCLDIFDDYAKAAQEVMRLSAPGDTIYVGVGHHDKVYANALAIYFLAERRPATKWAEVHTGVQTQWKVQQEMVAEMRKAPPRLVVLDTRWDGTEEPNGSRESSGVHLLDDFINENYVEAVRYGPTIVLRRR